MKKYGLYAIWVIASLATIGAFYLSEIKDVAPCTLCWYQRICLFPLVLLAGIGAFRGFLALCPFLMPQVFLGMLLALYQMLIQESTKYEVVKLCSFGPQCQDKIFLGLGPVTMAMMSLGIFTVIFILLVWIWALSRFGQKELDQEEF